MAMRVHSRDVPLVGASQVRFEALEEGLDALDVVGGIALENADLEELGRRGLGGPAIAVITGLRKPWMPRFRESDYRAVRLAR